MECQIAAFSRTGGRERNEDACGYVEQQGVLCCVLADGAGGHRGGDFASRTCVQAVLDGFSRCPEVSAAATAALLDQANDAILQQQQSSPDLGDMRSTAVLLIVDAARALATWGHVGDSRLYLFREGTLARRTRDHSMVQTMVESGILREEDALNRPDANVLFTSMGLAEAYSPEVLGDPFPVQAGDVFLLCSDGVWGTIAEGALPVHLVRSRSAAEWLNAIELDIARHARPDADNYSAIAVWCGDPADRMRTQPNGKRT